MDFKQIKQTQTLKREAEKFGFWDCRVATAGFLAEAADFLEEWLKNRQHGEMAFMENYFDLRTDPRKLMPETQSVVMLAYNYYPEEQQVHKDYQVSKYAYGRDYHKVIKKKLQKMDAVLKSELGDFQSRFFVDSAPVMEKQWAQKSGIGWQGKNTNIIHPQKGSFFFLATYLVDLKLEPDAPIKDYCGSCNKCVEACPTGALDEPYTLDASLCISYLTIELKKQIPERFKNQMEDWIFGCDICQDVCPWNRKFSQSHQEPDFEPRKPIVAFEKEDWENLSEETFKQHFSGTPIMRTKYEGLKRNIEFVKKGGNR